MSTRDAAIVALGEAIKFESDGRDFYQQAAERARDPLAKSVFEALAEDEKDHVRRVREIYEELKDKPGWPEPDAMVARRTGVLDVFERVAVAEVDADISAREALQKAREMEHQGVAFYRDRLEKASCASEAEFYRRLVEEEQVHLEALGRVLERIG